MPHSNPPGLPLLRLVAPCDCTRQSAWFLFCYSVGRATKQPVGAGDLLALEIVTRNQAQRHHQPIEVS